MQRCLHVGQQPLQVRGGGIAGHALWRCPAQAGDRPLPRTGRLEDAYNFRNQIGFGDAEIEPIVDYAALFAQHRQSALRLHDLFNRISAHRRDWTA